MLKIHDYFDQLGLMVSGIITEEVRENGVRTGFRIRNLETGDQGWLANIAEQEGPHVGKYEINERDLERVGAMSLVNAARGESRLVLIDEVGPMEMTSSSFRRALKEVLMRHKTVLASVKYGSRYAEIEEVSRLPDTRMLTMFSQNRDRLFPELVAMIKRSLA